MAFFDWSAIPKDVSPGVSLPAGMSRQTILCDDRMICMHEALPYLTCAPHTHEAEQVCIIIKGRLRLRISDAERILHPGDVAVIPCGIEHAIASLDEYVQVLDIFSPARPDILARMEEMRLVGHEACLSQLQG